MSDKKRTIEEIHQEYSRICSQAGHVQYQVSVLSKDLEQLNGQLRALNVEAAELNAAQSAAGGAQS